MTKPEEMRAFFAARVDGYDAHMLQNVQGVKEGYAQMTALLPEQTQDLLDLGCGTGLELETIFARFPKARVTGIDLTEAMLDALLRKFPGKALSLACGDYFAVDFGKARFDAAVSFETLHHFTHGEKRGLYCRVRSALRPGGVYVEADYMVRTQEEEDALFAARDRLLRGTSADEGRFHVDTPCSVENQIRLLREAGFSVVEKDWEMGNTVILVAKG